MPVGRAVTLAPVGLAARAGRGARAAAAKSIAISFGGSMDRAGAKLAGAEATFDRTWTTSGVLAVWPKVRPVGCPAQGGVFGSFTGGRHIYPVAG